MMILWEELSNCVMSIILHNQLLPCHQNLTLLNPRCVCLTYSLRRQGQHVQIKINVIQMCQIEPLGRIFISHPCTGWKQFNTTNLDTRLFSHSPAESVTFLETHQTRYYSKEEKNMSRGISQHHYIHPIFDQCLTLKQHWHVTQCNFTC